jgi:FdhD protein
MPASITPSFGQTAPSAETVISPSLHWSADEGLSAVPESLVVEAPLAMEIAYERGGQNVVRVLAVTMRTPGSDEALVLGFLRGEGLISSLADVRENVARENNARGEAMVTRRVTLARAPREELERVSRGLVTSSACGLCGRVSLEGLPLRASHRPAGERRLSGELIAGLPERLRRQQTTFFSTGGSHGAALCDASGEVLVVCEDVGRHNAVDKLVGVALLRGIAIEGKILVLSGRASFELLQKASAAGVGFVVAVGAPSSLAVTLAHAAGITLLGFARGHRFNVYSHADRIDLGALAAPASAIPGEGAGAR